MQHNSKSVRQLYLGIYLLCPHEHQSGVDLLQADEATVVDVVQERDSLHVLLDPWCMRLHNRSIRK